MGTGELLVRCLLAAFCAWMLYRAAREKLLSGEAAVFAAWIALAAALTCGLPADRNGSLVDLKFDYCHDKETTP